MGKLTRIESRLLRKLVGDCDTYGLKPEAELLYIRQELGKDVDIRTVNRIKVELQNDSTTKKWYSTFAKIGFVKTHKKLVEDLQRSYDDTMNRLFQEELKSPRNEGIVLRLKLDQRESALLIKEFSLGNPIIAAMQAKLDKAEVAKNRQTTV